MVANEVKELAKATAKATEDIGRRIESIQGETKGAVQAIGEISRLITQIDGVSNTIASAVEEQTATTNEIGRNILGSGARLRRDCQERGLRGRRGPVVDRAGERPILSGRHGR